MEQRFGTTQIEAQHIASIRTVTSVDRIGEPMGRLFEEVFGYLREQGREPAGMPFALYHAMDGQTVELSCGIPVAAPIEGSDRVQSGELPAGTVATVTHSGPYDGLPGTWSALTEWMRAQGLQPAGAPWEVYVTDPRVEHDQSKWRTDIFFPVR